MISSLFELIPGAEFHHRTVRRKTNFHAYQLDHWKTVLITISLAKVFLTHVPSGWYVVSDLDVSFPLPDQKFSDEHRRKHHKQKRQIWQQIEDALYVNNMDGRECVLRSICESKKYLAPPGKSLVHDLLRAIFTAPLQEDENEISEMYREILDPNFCDRPHNCPFSILDFILMLNKQKH
ncbi:uncharacterized protein LOC123698685 [Colias croceus]|uniref:uncharacterized protein LOC123698685 n=1 Tax=Colias crocea TaxID=72248 RepID=UPI001E27ACB3|nr:uncharacterized protein LOC123698685 [Colias croceus]